MTARKPSPSANTGDRSLNTTPACGKSGTSSTRSATSAAMTGPLSPLGPPAAGIVFSSMGSVSALATGAVRSGSTRPVAAGTLRRRLGARPWRGARAGQRVDPGRRVLRLVLELTGRDGRRGGLEPRAGGLLGARARRLGVRGALGQHPVGVVAVPLVEHLELDEPRGGQEQRGVGAGD